MDDIFTLTVAGSPEMGKIDSAIHSRGKTKHESLPLHAYDAIALEIDFRI